MSGLQDRFVPWLDLIRWLVGEPIREFPDELLLGTLSETFGCRAATNWVEPDGEFGFLMPNPPAGWPEAAELDFWAAGAMREHPLLCWFLATADLTATSLGRVPAQFGSARSRGLIREQLRPVELDQQMSIPFADSPTSHRTVILARTGEDFGDEDLVLARRIQPLLMLLERHVSSLRPISAPASTAPLSGRELAVLVLLSQGLTGFAIARRLGISVRTVHKHLEHLYRKLGVNDRLLAVQVGRSLGLLEPSDREAPRVPLTSRVSGTAGGQIVHVRVPFAPSAARA